MITHHSVIYSDSSRMDAVPSESVDLMVTSPPYPMIQMWDNLFARQSPKVGEALEKENGSGAFELMHSILDPIWDEVYRVLKFGGFACINIGDATRTMGGRFALYPNHARILQQLLNLGFTALPDILWRKQTNAPNKFMGSGMFPAGAYVTLEHEYVLIVRKGPKRRFQKEKDKKNRRESAIFWEERNVFYSDIWFDIKGTPQALQKTDARSRSAAFPFEMAYRLINMYSVKGDLVLDPFLGTGTTTCAAMASGRNSVGYEIDSAFRGVFGEIKKRIVPFSNRYIHNRLTRHIQFVIQRIKEKGPLKHQNNFYGFPVMTSQERELILNDLTYLKEVEGDTFQVTYREKPQEAFSKDWEQELKRKNLDRITEQPFFAIRNKNSDQLELF